MKTIKKSILSLILVCTVLMGSLSAMTVSASAASPQLNLVKGQDCFNVVWNKVPNASKYRLYFGGNCRWRRYTDLKLNEVSVYPKNTQSVQFLINSKALTGRYWAPYGEDKHISTSSIKTTESYCCQVEAFDSNNKHLAWTNVGYVYFGTTTVKAWTKPNSVGVSWNTASGSNTYQVAYRYGSQTTYTYAICSGSERQFVVNNPVKSTTYYFQVRPCVKVGDTIRAYGGWSKTSAVNTQFLTSYEEEVLKLVNQERAKRSLPQLSTNSNITEVAHVRAKELSQYFSHTRPNGKSCYTAADELGVPRSYAGENAAEGYSTPAAVVSGWMESQGHRNNILDPSFKKIGIGCYESNGRLYWIQFFTN